jgi:iron complex transport system permease protein
VSAFLSAVQTYLMQRHVDSLREVYSWLLGRLATAGWHDVLLVLPYAAVTCAIVLAPAPRAGRAHRRRRGGDGLGCIRSAAVTCHHSRRRWARRGRSVSGLIGFVGSSSAHAAPAGRAELPLDPPALRLFGAPSWPWPTCWRRTAGGQCGDPDRRG